MPGLESSYRDHRGRIVARVVLKTPGVWRNLSDEEKQAWSKATAACRELMDLYAPEPS